MEINEFILTREHVDGFFRKAELSDFAFEAARYVLNTEWNGRVSKYIVSPFTTRAIEKWDKQSRRKFYLQDEAKNANLLLFPLLDLQNKHWLGIAIDVPRKTATVLNSFTNVGKCDKFLENLRKELKRFQPQANNDFDIELISSATVPQQNNEFDCGVYLLQFFEQWGTTENVVIKDGFKVSFLRRMLDFAKNQSQKKRLVKPRMSEASKLAKDSAEFIGGTVNTKRVPKPRQVYSPGRFYIKMKVFATLFSFSLLILVFSLKRLRQN